MKKTLLSILLLFSIIFKAYSIPLDSTIHKSVSLFKSFIEKQEIDKKASIFTYTNDVTGSFEYINRGLPMLSNDNFYQQSLQIIQKIHTNTNNLYDNTKIYVFHGRYFLDINKNINKNTSWEEVKRNFTDKDKISPIFLDQGKERYINDLTKEIGNVAAAKYPQNPCVIIYFTELIQAKRAEVDSPFNINNNYDLFSTNSTEYGKINYQLTRHVAYSFLNADHIKERLSGMDFRQPLGTVNAPTQTSNYYNILLKNILTSIEQLLDDRQAAPAPVLCSACVTITEEGKKVENNAVAKETYYSHQGSLAYKAGWYRKTKYKEILSAYVENLIYIEGSCKISINPPCRSSDNEKEVLVSRNASFFDKKNFSANFAEIFGEIYNEKIAILGIPNGATYSVFSPLDLAGGLLVRGSVSLASYGFRSLSGFSGIVYSRSVPYLFRAYANTQGYVYMYGLGISTAGSEVLAFAYGLGGADDEFPIPAMGDNVGKNIRIIWRSRSYDKIKGIIRVKEGVSLDNATKKALISLVRKSIKQGKNIEVQINAIDDILIDGIKWVISGGNESLLDRITRLGLTALKNEINLLNAATKTKFLDDFVVASDDVLRKLNTDVSLVDLWKIHSDDFKGVRYITEVGVFKTCQSVLDNHPNGYLNNLAQQIINARTPTNAEQVIVGVTHPSFNGKIFMGRNFLNSENTLEIAFKTTTAHPLIRDRIKYMDFVRNSVTDNTGKVVNEALANKLLDIDNLDKLTRAGRAGYHGEVRALSDALYELEKTKPIISSTLSEFDILIRSSSNKVMQRCPCCFHITQGVKVLEGK